LTPFFAFFRTNHHRKWSDRNHFAVKSGERLRHWPSSAVHFPPSEWEDIRTKIQFEATESRPSRKTAFCQWRSRKNIRLLDQERKQQFLSRANYKNLKRIGCFRDFIVPHSQRGKRLPDSDRRSKLDR
jgi:hypothetical protein